jgi:co-chaperonin GroES (HSP10)
MSVETYTITAEGYTRAEAGENVIRAFHTFIDNNQLEPTDEYETWTDLDPSKVTFTSTYRFKARKRQLSSDYLKAGWRAKKGPVSSNTSGFRAVGHRVLLLPEEVEETTAGGIVLARQVVQKEEQAAVVCTVLEIGHDCWSDKSTDYCEVGDRVLVGMYTGKFHVSPVDGKKYRFVMDTDVISPLPKDVK